jgi:glycosyltransferase involved in cell wall biosynthesis
MRSIAIISSQAFSLVNFRGSLIRSMTERQIKVYAVAPDFDGVMRERVSVLGAQAVDCSFSRGGTNPLRDLIDIIKLTRLLRTLAPDVTLAYFIKPVIYGSIASWLARIPMRFAMIEGMGYAFADDASSYSGLRRVLRWLVAHLLRFAVRRNNRVFVLNQDDVALLIAEKMATEAQIVYLDGIGVDLEHYALAEPVVDPMTFVLMARMLREKGVYEFVEAARHVRMLYPRTRFLLVGGVDLNPGSITEAELRSWVEERLLEWPGQATDVRPWLAQASVFVLPSFYREGLPRGSQEAMSMGRPVITTDWVGCRETVEDGVNGFLVPVRDSRALAQAMIRFVQSPMLVEEMGRAGRLIAERRFDVRPINARIMQVLGL